MKNAYLRFLLFFGIFGCVPLGIGLSLGLHAISLEEAFRQERAVKDLDQDLSCIMRRIDPYSYIRHRFLPLSHRFFQKSLSGPEFTRVWTATQKKWGFEYEPYVFDGKGSLITPPNIPLTSRYLLQKLWDTLRDVKGNRSELEDKYKKSLTTVLGTTFRVNQLDQSQGFPLKIRRENVEGVVFWEKDPGSPFGGCVLINWRSPFPEEILKLRLRKPLRKSISLVSMVSHREPEFQAAPLDSTEIRLLLKTVQLQKQPWFYLAGRVWSMIETGRLTLLGGRLTGGLDMTRTRVILIGTILVLAMIMWVFWFRWLVLGRDMYLSIRIKLIFLFLFSVSIPLMGIAFLGYYTVNNRREILTNDALKAAKEVLVDLETEFGREGDRYLRIFRKLRDDPLLRSDFHQAAQKAIQLSKDRWITRYELLDIFGNIMFSLEGSTTLGRLTPVLQAMGRLTIERRLADRIPPAAAEAKPKPMDMMTRMVFENPELGFPDIMERPDEVHMLHFGTSQINWLFWDVFPDKNHPVAYMHVFQSISNAIDKFLERRLVSRHGYLKGGFRLLAQADVVGLWFPLGVRVNSAIENFVQKVRITQQQVSGRITWHGIPYLAFGMPGKNIGEHALLAMYPENEIYRDIAVFRRNILGGMILAVLIALLTGFVFSMTFLEPIGEITQGINALRERHTNYRVPVLQKDELGDLSMLFNQMIEEVSEMQMAKVVQESLIPQEMPNMAGFEFALSNTTASDLGGDYCDVMPMQDGRMLVVIGDVTGHGVSSALLMTMAKTVVYLFSKEGTSVRDLILKLDSLVFTLLRRHKMMTFFASIVDPVTGTLTYCCAGHPFPFYLKTDGTAESLKMVNYPLGVGLKPERVKEKSVVLAPGEVILMYTDGIVESASPTGEVFGYERFRNVALPLRHQSAEEIRKAMYQSFRDHHGPGSPDDDITLVVVKRT